MQRTRTALRIFGLTLALAAGMLTAGQAHAGYVVCQSDPVVVLSNGYTVTMQATVTAAPSQIRDVEYVLHLPSGVSVNTVTYSGDLTPNMESFAFVNDQPLNTYVSSMQIDTRSIGVAVTNTSSVQKNAPKKTIVSAVATGKSNAMINVTMTLTK